jgi:Na+-transporting methylmalonyl-CoA/oxaloacetate decarboxylase gamma subunit
MNSIAIHFVPAVMSLSPLWLYLSVGGTVIVFLLLIFLVKSLRRKGKAELKPEKQPISQKADIQKILKVLQKSNGRVRPVLLAASGLADLPVTIPVNLAVSLASTGKCLLIDLDSKRDALAKVFEVDSSKFETHLKVTPLPTEFENLSVWPARYFDLLKQMNLRSLLDAVGKQYDYILLYAPYLTVLADRKQIAFCSKQAIIFCEDSERTAHLRRLLKTCDCEILLDA